MSTRRRKQQQQLFRQNSPHKSSTPNWLTNLPKIITSPSLSDQIGRRGQFLFFFKNLDSSSLSPRWVVVIDPLSRRKDTCTWTDGGPKMRERESLREEIQAHFLCSRADPFPENVSVKRGGWRAKAVRTKRSSTADSPTPGRDKRRLEGRGSSVNHVLCLISFVEK